MNKITIETKDPTNLKLKEGQFYIRGNDVITEIYLVIKAERGLRLARLNDGYIWDNRSTWGGYENQFTLVTSPFTVEPCYENH